MKQLQFFILAFIFGFPLAGWGAVSCNITPSNVRTGETYNISFDAGLDLPSKYQIKVSANGSSGTLTLSGGPRLWTKSITPTNAGTFVFDFKAYDTSTGQLGSTICTASVTVTPQPSVSSVSPLSATLGVSQTFTVYGSNLPSTIALSLEGTPSTSCTGPFSVTSTSAKLTCTPTVAGNKRFYVGDHLNGTAISGSTSLYVNVTIPATDNPPVVTINTPGSGDPNPKTGNFNLDVTITDDIGLQAVAYEVQTSSFGSTGQIGSKTLTGKSGAATFPIDVNSLPVGSYKILVRASDTKPQASNDQWYWFQKVATTDNPPTVTINTPGSNVSNNPKSADFTLSVTVTDDKGLNQLAYAVLTSASGSTGQSGVLNLTGTSETKSIPIDLDSLAVGTYKISVGATDSSSQPSDFKLYWFQKVEDTSLPNITPPIISEGIIEETGLNFKVTLSRPLPDGYGVFLNFDNRQGGWYQQTDDGGHSPLLSEGNGVYSGNYRLQYPSLRAVRAGIFDLHGDNIPGNDTLVGNWSSVVTCTEAPCLDATVLPNSYGDPAVNGGGSQLFKQVDVASGNYHLSVTDMAVDGKGPAFSFSRAYNSLALKPWTFAYEAKTAFQAGTGSHEISIGPREDGRMQYFYKDWNDNQWYALNVGNFDQLIENGDGSFVLYTQGNRLYRFANPTTPEAGRLQSIEDRLGNKLAFQYNGNNLIGATDANGRHYTITRDANNRIQRVTEFTTPNHTARYVEYSYDSNGMISNVRNMRGGNHHYSYVGNTGFNSYRLASITDPRGNVQMNIDYADVTFNIDGDNDTQGRVVSLTDGVGNVTEFSYPFIDLASSPFYLKEATAIKQPFVDGINTNVAFILDKRRTHVEARLDTVNAAEYARKQRYKALQDRQHLAETALVDQVTDPKNNSTAINYDDVARNRPSIVTDAAGNDHFASYTEIPDAHNLTAMTASRQPGVFTPTVFDTFTPTGQAGTITDPRGYSTSRNFDPNNNYWLTAVTNPRNNTTSYTYDAFGHVENTNEPLGRQTQRHYDDLGRVTDETSPSGLVTTYTYDEHGNILTKNEQAAGINYTTHYGYDESDNLIWTVDPRGHRTDYYYDALNRKIEERYQVANVQHNRLYGYDGMGRLKTVTNERGKTSTTHYDTRSQVTQKIKPIDETRTEITTYTYDANGNVASVTDGAGHTVTYSYDVLNRKIEERDENNNVQSWTYWPTGQVQSHRDGRGEETWYSYDASGNLVETSEPNATTTATYDGNGNVLTVTDAKGHATRYTYDALDRRVTTRLHDGQTWQYAYDVAGNLTSEITPSGEKTLQSFDALGRVTQHTEYAANNSITRQMSYIYDANSNVTSITSGGNTISYSYDEVNRISSVTDQYGQTLSYAYDKAGNRTRLTYPGNKAVNYAYDEADRLLSLTDWLNKTTEYTRNAAGQVTDVLNGNGTKVHYEYDAAGRMNLLDNLYANGSPISTIDWLMDGAGNITELDADLPLTPTLPTSINNLTYDNNNRLLSADGTSYTHDPSGRIVQKAANGTQTVYNFDINDHISRISLGGTTVSQYSYDLNNNRISRIQNGTETRYVIDSLASLPNVVAETNTQGSILRYYLYGEGLVSQIDAAGNSHYYHFEQTGHTIALTDANGVISDKYAYTPYGHTTSQGSTPNPFKFVGKHGVMDDGNGLHYMRARYYKEDINRFMSLDALHGDMVTPQALNRYAYVMGNPVMGVDPSGYCTGETGQGSCVSSTDLNINNREDPIVKFVSKYSNEVGFVFDIADSGSHFYKGVSGLISVSKVIDACEIDPESCYKTTAVESAAQTVSLVGGMCGPFVAVCNYVFGKAAELFVWQLFENADNSGQKMKQYFLEKERREQRENYENIEKLRH